MVLDDIWGRLTNRPNLPITLLLTDTGLPTGNHSVTGNYSTVPKDFWVGPPQGVNYYLLSLSIYLTMLPAPQKAQYGQILTGLTNGIDFIFRRHDDEYERKVIPAGPIKTNQDIVVANGRPVKTGLNGNDELFVFEFSFVANFGGPLPLYGTSADRFIVRVNDDFTALTTHKFSVNGVREAISKDQML